MARDIGPDDHVTVLYGVGESIADSLAEAGVETVADAALAEPAEMIDGAAIRDAVAAKISTQAREAVVDHPVTGLGGRYKCRDCSFETTKTSQAVNHVQKYNDGMPGCARVLIVD